MEWGWGWEKRSARQSVILSLNIFNQPHWKDEQCGAYESINPLSLDRASENRALSSNSTLFQLPIEILGEVLKHVCVASLPNFALSCRDACALARTRQFSEVVLDYSQNSWDLLDKIASEHLERSSNGRTKLPSIGACVRSLSVLTRGENMTAKYGVHPRTFQSMEEDEAEQRLTEGSQAYFGPYLGAIAFALTSGLPNLNFLRWGDMTVVPSSIFEAIARSHIKRLTFFRSSVDESFDLIESLKAKKLEPTLSLRSLSFSLSWTHLGNGKKPPEGSSKVRDSLLTLCAPSLERLAWSSTGDEESYLGPLAFPAFTKLRELKIPRHGFSDSEYLRKLIPEEPYCRIRILEASPDANDATKSFFRERGTISSLQNFVWDSSPSQKLVSRKVASPEDEGSGILALLHANPQITKLAMYGSADPELLGDHILPLLGGKFDELNSLSLIWAEESVGIAEASLRMVGKLTSLEQLHVSAGTQGGRSYTWYIDHGVMLRALKPLQHLKILAFSRDTYNPGWTPAVLARHERYRAGYYFTRYTKQTIRSVNASVASLLQSEDGSGEFPASAAASDSDSEPDNSEDDNAARRQAKWEQRHKKRMLRYADNYFAVLPKLELLYLGQLHIHRLPDTNHLWVESKTTTRTWVNTTFGWPYPDDS